MYPEASALRGPDVAAHLFPRVFGQLAPSRMFDALRRLVDEFKPDLIVNEAAEFAAPIIAASLDIPHATHSFGLAIPKERVATTSLATADLWASVGLEPQPYGGMYSVLYIDIYPPSMQPDDLGHIQRIVRRRPESSDAHPGERLPETVSAALHSGEGRPVVYLTFGTIYTGGAALAAAVEGLARLDATVIVTVGPGGDVDQFEPRPPNVHVEQYIPQSLLLPHCAAVVSHGGSGTLLASLARGLPSALLPQAADQFRNANAATAVGAALARFGAEIIADNIEGDTRRVLTEPSFRAAAGRIRGEIAMMPSADEVVTMLARL